LKRKFLITIGLVLTIAVGAVGILQTILFRSEQYRQIDSRIETTATLLISSELPDADLKEFEEAEDIITETIGGERFNQFIVIYGKDGKELYRSPRADLLPDHLSTDIKWQTIEQDGHVIRVLTLPLKSFHVGRPKDRAVTHRRILQTGLILDEDLLRWTEINRYIWVFSIFTILMILLATFSLSEALLKPLKDLTQYLRYLGRSFSERRMVTDDAQGVRPLPFAPGDDEFGDLVREVQALHGRINDSLKNTQAWTAQMAHEMKTPLTILQNSLESARAGADLPSVHLALDEANTEIAHLNALITGFLDWASAENFSSGRDIVHAVRLDALVRELVDKIGRQHPGRLQVSGSTQLIVFAKRSFVQQAISNLVTNGLKYSPESQSVELILSERMVTVKDHGPGLLPDVVAKIGRPFNHGAVAGRGFGLGLAWVATICHKYGWQLSFERVPDGAAGKGGECTAAQIKFPEDPNELES
jgi:signal transduction histidine kinase